MNKTPADRKLLEIYAGYHSPMHLSMDPLEFVRQFNDPAGIELAGLAAAAFAYGRVEQIRKSLDRLLAAAGGSFTDFARRLSYPDKLSALRGFKHRFNDGTDAALLFECAARLTKVHGSLGAFFASQTTPGDPTIKRGLHAFSTAFRSAAEKLTGARRPTFEYLFPSPESGSACKRLCMYLRWMVRKDDGIDVGLWTGLSPAQLVMPVDTHVARVARSLRLVRRTIPDWKMAEALTRRLKKADPGDPTRFDFSLCTYGKRAFRARGRQGSKGEMSNGGLSP